MVNHFLSILIIVFFHNGFCQTLHYKRSSRLDPLLAESSGLVIASDSSFYTINDGGNEPFLYEIGLEGNILRAIKINAKNTDWEDLARDEFGNLYIGDFGNNLNQRKDLSILKIPIECLKQEKIDPVKFSFRYEDQTSFPPDKNKLYYDCEGFYVFNNQAFLFTKNRTEPFDGISKLYKLDLDKKDQTAVKWNELKLCTKGWYPCSVTSVDYNFISKELYLLSYSQIIKIKGFLNLKNVNYKTEYISIKKLEQFESICISNTGEIYLTSERQKLIGGGRIHQTYIK